MDKIKQNISIILGSASGYSVVLSNQWTGLLIESIERMVLAVITALVVTVVTFFTKRILDNKFNK